MISIIMGLLLLNQINYEATMSSLIIEHMVYFSLIMVFVSIGAYYTGLPMETFTKQQWALLEEGRRIKD